MARLIDTPAFPLTSTDVAFSLRTELTTSESSVQRLWRRIALGATLFVAFFMRFFLLGQNGYGEFYYAAGVRSMMDSWHNFFFVAYDPGGFVSLDKPPVGLWLEVGSAKLLGFSPFSLFLPQAICGVLAVWLLAALVRRHFGVVAALLAALALALSPLSVVTDRNNTLDGTLVLALLLAAWAFIRACESSKVRWLLLSAIFIGIGFNIKMAEAYLIFPAFVITYLVCGPHKVWTRTWHLSLFLLVMLVVSFAWIIAVDATPAAQRPYVGSSQTNSELGLAIGYNGIYRLVANNNVAAWKEQHKEETVAIPTSVLNQLRGASAGGTQTPAVLSLFNSSLGSQIAWLLPLALLAIFALALIVRRRFKRQYLGLIFWGSWLLTTGIFFTLDNPSHQYYMTTMAPAICALCGVGLVVMWGEYRGASWRWVLLPLALAVTVAVQCFVLVGYPTWASWLTPLIADCTALAVVTLLAVRLGMRMQPSRDFMRPARVALVVGVLAVILAPTVWSAYTVLTNTESFFPTAGPSAGSGSQFSSLNGIPPRFQALLASIFYNTTISPLLLNYLESQEGKTTFLVATPSSSMADPLIMATNRPIMALGGYLGSDPILTPASLQTLVHNNTIRFFLFNSQKAIQQIIAQVPVQYRVLIATIISLGDPGDTPLSLWVGSHCRAVPAAQWEISVSTNQLYDCASAT